MLNITLKEKSDLTLRIVIFITHHKTMQTYEEDTDIDEDTDEEFEEFIAKFTEVIAGDEDDKEDEEGNDIAIDIIYDGDGDGDEFPELVDSLFDDDMAMSCWSFSSFWSFSS